ncbi:MAG TPA: DUF4215 domain-containing protein, partial [Polyangiaceae bacterium]|nr:DUF4215 domain-containing protein [Polyangiaceae bacterium]
MSAVLVACGSEHDHDMGADDVPALDGGSDASEILTDASDSGPQLIDGGKRDSGVRSDAGAPAVCGDGMRSADSGEDCDDGNQSDGDGCDRACHVEAGYSCAAMGGGCAPVCGDGLTVASEACDDHNTSAGDGCSQNCQVESGWACPVPGQACTAARCGDGMMVGAEQCDDGNALPGDGCSASCTLEAGWICVGTTCSAASCGDGTVAGHERCDDGNTMSGDGCLMDCSAVEPNYACPVQGGACHKTTTCGDGVLTSDEACDDGNLRSSDGCSASCTVEAGYTCVAGSDCGPVCGDGLVRGTEQCDDGASTQPGCSATCQLEPGYFCPTPGQACQLAVCGNGVVEGLEQCDDGDDELGDGCTPLCTREPSCMNGECVATCGDGIVASSEACDDGNNASGDGCSATCAVEAGFHCSSVDNVPPVNVDLPLVLRDFKSYNVSGGHIDFNNVTASETGIVRSALGVDTNNDG